MDYAAAQSALKTLVTSVLGWTSPTDPVVFENEPRPRHNGRIAILSWVSGVGVGVDDLRWEDNGALAPDPNYVPTLAGDRMLALQVSVETLDQSPGAPHARAALEQFRTRIRRPSSLAALRAANLGMVDVGAVSQADYRVDNRMISRALIELRLNATTFDRDDDGAIGTIESTDITSHISDVDGTQLPASLQMNAENIP